MKYALAAVTTVSQIGAMLLVLIFYGFVIKTVIILGLLTVSSLVLVYLILLLVPDDKYDTRR